MDPYFTDKKITELVTRHNWELVPADVGSKHKLRQKDRRYMTTVDFDASDEIVSKFCVTPNAQVNPRPCRERNENE